jgi:hypothetical protein
LKYACPPLSVARYMPTLPFLQLISISAGFCRKEYSREFPQGLGQEKDTKTMGKSDRRNRVMVLVSS